MKQNIKYTLMIALSTLIAGVFLGWLFFHGSAETPASHAQDATAENATIWTCSMHPQIRKNEPGNCPICGMELIPLTDNQQDSHPMAINMTQAAMQLAQVEVMTVQKGSPEKTVRLNGKIQTDERRVFSQTSHIPGRVEKLMVDFTGEYIKKGQPLAILYSPELVSAQKELLEAQKIKETQPQLFQAAKEKLKNWKLTDDQISRILQDGKSQENFTVFADVSGYTTSKKVNLGDYLKQGETLYEISDLSRVWVLFDVYESDIVWVKKGEKVSFEVGAFPGKIQSGIISFFDPVMDPTTRVAQARVELSNSQSLYKPEMFVSGTILAKLPAQKDVVVIPKSAVLWTGKRSVVYVKLPDPQTTLFEMRQITLGPSLGDAYLVESGLEAGEEIAVNGTFSIDAAAQLAGKPSMMNNQGAPAMAGHNHGKMEN